MKQYIEVIEKVLKEGLLKEDRTGTGTKGIIGTFNRYALQEEGKRVVPMVTSKKTNFDPIKRELLWFIRGETNIGTLGSKIWDEWADLNGDLGPIYGKQWRFWDDTKIIHPRLLNEFLKRGYKYMGSLDCPLKLDDSVVVRREIDQLQGAIDLLRTNPDSRRIIVSAWNPGDLEDMALPPCHCFFQFFSEEVDGKRYLTCLLYQRSADVFLGVPFNIASYSLLTHLVAQITNHTAVAFIHVTGDTHLYQNHLDLAEGLLGAPRYPQAELLLNPKEEIDDFQFEDIELKGYQSGPVIKAPVAI